MLSSRVYQNITYHCRKSIAFYDAVGKSYKKAIIFSSADDHEIVGATRPKYQYKVSTDGCKVQISSIYYFFLISNDFLQRLSIFVKAMLEFVFH